MTHDSMASGQKPTLEVIGALHIAREAAATIRRSIFGSQNFTDAALQLTSAVLILDNAGVFSPIDEHTGYDIGEPVTEADLMSEGQKLFAAPGGASE